MFPLLVGLFNRPTGGGGSQALIASPAFLSGTVRNSNTATTAQATTATPSGLISPIAYEWVQTSGDSDIFPNSPASNVTRFYGYTDLFPDIKRASFKCVATDANGTTAESNEVSINLRFNV